MPDQYESIRAIELRVMALEQAHAALNAAVATNTQITASIKDDTSDLVDFAKATKGLVTFAKWLGVFVKWGASIAAAWFAVWSYFKGGR